MYYVCDGYYGNPAILEYYKWCSICQKYFVVNVSEHLELNEIGNYTFIPGNLICPICDGYGE